MRKCIKIQREITPRGACPTRSRALTVPLTIAFSLVQRQTKVREGYEATAPFWVRETEIPFQNPNLLSETYDFGSTGEILFGELDRRARYRLHSGGFWLILWDLKWRLGAFQPMRLSLSFRQGVLVRRVLIGNGSIVNVCFLRYASSFFFPSASRSS